ncbi:glycosyltransferase family 2 protein [Thermoanaerobacterium sp. CMT5567-10]|uniref:glycosyltransferase family 2 protein n=1 Tax=Thermoanaerobacterium sp. CMT5567-10 TaxID=3061989 RepID=UPI0026DF9FC9|nr:glycosyltransferase family 2 protein [Thermoanaerobacterium sp. CMT5567-10]WKV08009.1 glycosyltransferase family 2 protein [Thermoanaerobacterium sp. CMT5567-10]
MQNFNKKILMMILNWNGKIAILECLESIKNLNYNKKNLIIVSIDNGSSDGSVEAIKKKYEQLRGVGFEYLEVVKLNENVGAPKAYNYALSNIKYEYDYILKLDNDVVFNDRDIINKLLNKTETDKKIGIIGPKIVYYDNPNQCAHAAGYINWLWGLPYTSNEDYEGECDFVTGCCMLIKREIIDKLGVFLDEDYFIYWDDTDLCMRAKNNGYKVYYFPATKIVHKVSKSTGLKKRSNFAIYYMMRNRVLFVKKNAPTILRKFVNIYIYLWFLRYVLPKLRKGKKGINEIKITYKAIIDGINNVSGKII